MPFDGTTVNETAQILLRGKERIQRRGWVQGTSYGPGGTVCMFAAVRGETELSVDGAMALAALGAAIGDHVGTWNDAPGRTLDEVLDAFDRAVEIALSAA